MGDAPSSSRLPAELAAWVTTVRARTPARVLKGRAGPGYRTETQLDLRVDHAFARDAVRAEIDLERDLGREFLDRWKLLELNSLAASKDAFLMRPELGRCLDARSRAALIEDGSPGADLQVAVADGLSAAAIVAQVPPLLPLLEEQTRRRGWRFGRPVFVRHGRVGLLNDLGAVLRPAVLVLLIGERPGLATAESLSAYLAYRPGPGHTDANRNLISNIHPRGVDVSSAADRIAKLAERMLALSTSGVALKEERSAVDVSDRPGLADSPAS